MTKMGAWDSCLVPGLSFSFLFNSFDASIGYGDGNGYGNDAILQITEENDRLPFLTVRRPV